MKNPDNKNLLGLIALALATDPNDLKASVELQKKLTAFREDNGLAGSDEQSTLAGAVLRAAEVATPTADATYALGLTQPKQEETPVVPTTPASDEADAPAAEDADATTAKRGPGRPRKGGDTAE